MGWGCNNVVLEKKNIFFFVNKREEGGRDRKFLRVPVSQNRACSCINVRYTTCSKRNI